MVNAAIDQVLGDKAPGKDGFTFAFFESSYIHIDFRPSTQSQICAWKTSIGSAMQTSCFSQKKRGPKTSPIFVLLPSHP
jgi:hypothetical protein